MLLSYEDQRAINLWVNKLAPNKETFWEKCVLVFLGRGAMPEVAIDMANRIMAANPNYSNSEK